MMNKNELEIERLLGRAADRAWQIGRLDVHAAIIRAVNTLRGFIARPVPDTRDADQRDIEEYADECGVTVSEILNK
jgi:hypothetical protein